MISEEEAFQILNIENQDDALDAFEDALFEIKQFYITRTPVRKLWEAKYRKLRRLEEAIAVFEEISVDRIQFELKEMDLQNLRSSVNSYYQQRGELNRAISLVNSVEGLIQLSQSQLDLVKSYASLWTKVDVSDVTTEVLLSKEPDPMDVLKAIEVESFEEINGLSSDHPLRIEAKRLQLWLEYSE